jgi:tyrosyl-tRNA synthetase
MIVKPGLISELQWRGLLHDIMPGTQDLLDKNATKVYCGFDPTSDSLHIGNLVPIILLKHLQNYGHCPIALVGGATGMVGDPSGKSAERNLLDINTLHHNEACIKKQLSQFLNFDTTIANPAEIVNNFDWFKDFSFLDFIRDVGKHITVNYMMSKDSVQKRLEGGMSFTEFSYQLIQGYDFFHLFKHKDVKVQAAGSDQWGNIVTGTELIRRIGGGEGFAFTSPLITKADGSKFGKSEGGNVWLDPNKTSPFKFYQFWINTSDEDAKKYIKIFSFLNHAEIETIIANHDADPGKRQLQKTLAQEVTILVHGEQALINAIATTEKLFNSNTIEALKQLSEEELMLFLDGVPQHKVALSKIKDQDTYVGLLCESGILPSKTEARKLIEGGGLSINKEKVNDVIGKFTEQNLLFNKYILIQKGKKNNYLLVCE